MTAPLTGPRPEPTIEIAERPLAGYHPTHYAPPPTGAPPPRPPRYPRDAGDDLPEVPRDLRSRTLDDKLSVAGAAIGALGLVWLIAERIMPVHGLLGFVPLWFLAYVALYAAVTAVGNSAVVVKDRLASAVVTGGAVLCGLILVGAVSFITYRSWPAVRGHVNFVTQTMAGVGTNDPFTRGGILHAIVGSLIEVGIAVAVTLPLGVGAAVYMSEVGGKFARLVRTVVEAMTALPSIVAGLFIYATLIVYVHFPRSGFAAAMAISVMMLPIIARASDVVLRIVPGGLREAGLALGSTQWRTVWHVVLPTARPGLATALILGVARGVGETSPVLLTSGASTFLNPNLAHNPIDQLFHDPMNSLPLFIYFAVRSGEPNFIARGYGAAGVLLVVVLTLFVIARRLARQRGGR